MTAIHTLPGSRASNRFFDSWAPRKGLVEVWAIVQQIGASWQWLCLAPRRHCSRLQKGL